MNRQQREQEFMRLNRQVKHTVAKKDYTRRELKYILARCVNGNEDKSMQPIKKLYTDLLEPTGFKLADFGIKWTIGLEDVMSVTTSLTEDRTRAIKPKAKV